MRNKLQRSSHVIHFLFIFPFANMKLQIVKYLPFREIRQFRGSVKSAERRGAKLISHCHGMSPAFIQWQVFYFFCNFREKLDYFRSIFDMVIHFHGTAWKQMTFTAKIGRKKKFPRQLQKIIFSKENGTSVEGVHCNFFMLKMQVLSLFDWICSLDYREVICWLWNYLCSK